MRTLGRPLLVLAGLAVSLWTAAPAAARVIATTGRYPGPVLSQGPVISNGVVAWLTTDCLRPCDPNGVERDEAERFKVHRKRPGRRSVVVATGGLGGQSSGPNWFQSSVNFHASDTHLALERVSLGSDEFDGDYGGVTLRAGAFGAHPMSLVARCSASDGAPRPSGVALSGAVLAYDATPCKSTSTLAVRNLNGGSEWRMPQPPGSYIDALRRAGGHVALSLVDTLSPRPPYNARHVVVMDTSRSEVGYELHFPDPPRLDDFELSADGSLAVLTDRTSGLCDGRVTRYGPDGRPGAPIGGACELVAALPDGTVLVTGRGRSRRIVHAGINSSPPHRIVKLGRRPLRGADADGNRLVWAVRSCLGADTIHVDRLSKTISVPPCAR